MKTERLMHFAVEDDTISCHVTCTKYETQTGTTYRVSYHSQFPGDKISDAVPLEVEAFDSVSDALKHAAHLRAVMRDKVHKAM